MLREWMRRLRARRDERAAERYGRLSAEERVDLERARADLAATRVSERMAGRRFDRELDAEEGRPGS